MPTIERDPWRTRYFENIVYPSDVMIPTEDPDAYQCYPVHRWVYSKLTVAENQGLECGPHGVTPPRFPIFSKPIYNMRGMHRQQGNLLERGIGARSTAGSFMDADAGRREKVLRNSHEEWYN